MFYTIGEVADMFQVNASLIRFWEKEFPIIKPKKNAKGNRLFRPEDIKNLQIIYHLVKEQGMTLKGAKKRIQNNKEGTQQNIEIINKLTAIKQKLLAIQEHL
ncbi:MAG: MerR family transcriptional regulator [Fibrobacter sp.]|nr:MerR family transcriptional regulator [Fibrobacter sp.]